MSEVDHWASIEEAIELCANDTAGLSHPIHFDYETYEPPGTQAFDALLALIDALPTDLQPAALALAQDRLRSVPSHLRREVVTDATLPALAASRAWPLIRSLTFEGTDGGSSIVATGEQRLSALEHICVRGDSLAPAAIDCLSRLSQFGSLQSVEDQGTVASKEVERLPARWIEALARLAVVVEIAERDLENVPRWQLQRVGLVTTPRAIELLAQRNTGRLQELSLIVLEDAPDAAFETLLRNRPLLSGLTSLDITMDLTDDQFARLVRCPELSQLERLSIRPFIEQQVISPAGIEALARAPFLPRLTSLSLNQQPLTGVGWQHLSHVPFERLTSLDLTRTKGGEAGMLALLGARWFAGLRDIDLTDCDIGPHGAAALASSEATARLVSLRLGDNGINNSGVAALADSPHFQSLREAVIGDIGNWGFGELTRADWFHHLQSILVTAVDDGSDVDALQALAASGEFPNLISFKFGYHATDDGLASLAKAQSLPRLRRLVLQHNGELTARGIEAIVSSPMLQKVWDLSFDHCPIGDEGARLLASPGVLRELVKLNVWNCDLTRAGSAALAQSEAARTLRWLSIDGNFQPWLDSPTVNPLLRARLAG